MEKKTSIENSPHKQMYICMVIAWILFLIPIPLTSILSYPLLLVTFILAIICLTKNDLKNGIAGILLVLLCSPIVHLIGVTLFAGIMGSMNQSHM